MRVIRDTFSWVEVDAHLHGLPSRDAEVVALKFRAMSSRLLRLCGLEHKGAGKDQHGAGDDSSRFHVALLSSRHLTQRYCLLSTKVHAMPLQIGEMLRQKLRRGKSPVAALYG